MELRAVRLLARLTRHRAGPLPGRRARTTPRTAHPRHPAADTCPPVPPNLAAPAPRTAAPRPHDQATAAARARPAVRAVRQKPASATERDRAKRPAPATNRRIGMSINLIGIRYPRHAEHPFRCRLSHRAIVVLLLTMGILNRLLTCIVTVTAGYLGTYSTYVERSGLPCPLGCQQCYRPPARLAPSWAAPLGRTDSRWATSGVCLASARFAASSFTKTGH